MKFDEAIELLRFELDNWGAPKYFKDGTTLQQAYCDGLSRAIALLERGYAPMPMAKEVGKKKP